MCGCAPRRAKWTAASASRRTASTGLEHQNALLELENQDVLLELVIRKMGLFEQVEQQSVQKKLRTVVITVMVMVDDFDDD